MASLPLRNSPAADRRCVRRWLVDCPATLRTAGGTHHGRMTDLSEKGARFEGPALPGEATPAMLGWRGQEVFGRVAWRRDGACGLTFDRAIGSDLVEESAHGLEESSVPVAQCGRIPVGRRRSGLAPLGD